MDVKVTSYTNKANLNVIAEIEEEINDVNEKLKLKANTSTTYTKEQIDSLLAAKEPLKSSSQNYVTDGQLLVLSNTSGTNTGNETKSSILSKLGVTTLSGSNTGDETSATIISKLGYTPASNTLASKICIGDTGAPAFQNNWVNYDTSHTQCACYKDNFGIVHLEGFVKSGTAGTCVFTLPTGYRPSLSINTPIICYNTTIGYCGILPAGSVYIFGTNASTWASLDGISFRAS